MTNWTASCHTFAQTVIIEKASNLRTKRLPRTARFFVSSPNDLKTLDFWLPCAAIGRAEWLLAQALKSVLA
jgi:hypothetical protein